MIAFIISLVAFLAFNVAIFARYGMPTSVSESCFLMPERYGRHLFFLFCVLTALPLLIFWLDVYTGPLQFLAFFSCAGLMFVGAAAEFKQIGLTRNVHFGGASICAICSQLWVTFTSHWWIASVVLFIAAGILSWRFKGVDADGQTHSAWLYFFEMAAFLSIYIALFAYYV